jgi:ABC-type proline/glycine betaine transport system substrate-binding protein
LVEVGLPPFSAEAPLATDWPADETYNYGSPTLKDRAPEVYQFLKKLKLTNGQQSPLILSVDIDEVPLDKAVRDWMAANEDVWKSWL